MGQSPVLYAAADNVVVVTNDTGAGNAADIALRASDRQRLWSFPASYGSPVASIVAGGDLHPTLVRSGCKKISLNW